MECLVVRNEKGEISSVSAAMTEEDMEDHKELLKTAGTDEDRMSVVSKETGRQLKRQMV